MTTPTAFFALWPPAPAATALHAWAEGLSGQGAARVTRPESIHITLAYVGRVAQTDLDRLVEVGAEARLQAHAMVLDQVGYWAHNKILWAGPTRTPRPLARLVRSLRRALQDAHFPVDRRTFQPHLSLLRKAAPPHDLPIFSPLAWRVEDFVLARSDQSVIKQPGSASVTRTDYRVVERFPAEAG